MSTPDQFPPNGFHIVRGIDTPYGPINILDENVGLKMRIDLLADVVKVDSDPEHQDLPAEI